MSVLPKISRYWWCQLAGWGVVGLSFIFAAYSFRQPISREYLLKTLIVAAGGILSTHFLRWVIKRYNWLMLPVEKVILRLSVGVVCTTVVYSVLILGLSQLTGLDENRRNLDATTRLLAGILNWGIFIIPWALLYYFYHYLQKSRKQQLDTLKLGALVKELELKTIKSHINPHFIFNALNSIRALIDEEPRRARDAVTHLSNILRSSMQAQKTETVPFENELNIVKDYLALEHIRFEDRLKIEYSIDTNTLALPVPPMMLQTLVENAIKHGLGKQVNGGVVKLISGRTEAYHELVVKNSGSLGNGTPQGDGFGLASTRSRLSILFGEKAGFEITQQGDLVVARILIPIQKQ